MANNWKNGEFGLQYLSNVNGYFNDLNDSFNDNIELVFTDKPSLDSVVYTDKSTLKNTTYTDKPSLNNETYDDKGINA